MATKTAINAKPRTFSTRVDLPEQTRARVIDMLNQFLADTLDMASQAKQAHWNVKGPEFYHLHLLFDEIAGEMFEAVDEIAERVTALGGYARGTVRMSAEHSRLGEYPTDAVDSMAHVKALSEKLGTFANEVRRGIDQSAELGDQGTADLLTALVREADKRLWFLEAHLQGKV